MSKELLEIKKDGLLLGGKPFYLASGSFHYYRTMPGGWRKRLELMKDFGLTAVQTYVAWNIHEPEDLISPACWIFPRSCLFARKWASR